MWPLSIDLNAKRPKVGRDVVHLALKGVSPLSLSLGNCCQRIFGLHASAPESGSGSETHSECACIWLDYIPFYALYIIHNTHWHSHSHFSHLFRLSLRRPLCHNRIFSYCLAPKTFVHFECGQTENLAKKIYRAGPLMHISVAQKIIIKCPDHGIPPSPKIIAYFSANCL